MRRLLDLLFGCHGHHHWTTVWTPGPTGKGSEMVICSRCDEIGYRL